MKYIKYLNTLLSDSFLNNLCISIHAHFILVYFFTSHGKFRYEI